MPTVWGWHGWARWGVCPGHLEGGTCIFNDAECGQYLLTSSTKHTSHSSQCRFRAHSLCAQQGTRSLSIRLSTSKKRTWIGQLCVYVFDIIIGWKIWLFICLRHPLLPSNLGMSILESSGHLSSYFYHPGASLDKRTGERWLRSRGS